MRRCTINRENRKYSKRVEGGKKGRCEVGLLLGDSERNVAIVMIDGYTAMSNDIKLVAL